MSFYGIFFIMFPTAVSFVEPTLIRQIFINKMEIIRIVRRKDKWIIRRGGKSPNRIFRGNRYGSWDQIRGIACSFMRGGSIINGDKR